MGRCHEQCFATCRVPEATRKALLRQSCPLVHAPLVSSMPRSRFLSYRRVHCKALSAIRSRLRVASLIRFAWPNVETYLHGEVRQSPWHAWCRVPTQPHTIPTRHSVATFLRMVFADNSTGQCRFPGGVGVYTTIPTRIPLPRNDTIVNHVVCLGTATVAVTST